MKRTMLIALSSAILLVACSKKNSEPIPPATSSIEGYWVGKYNSTGGNEEKISMLFKPGGVLRVYAIEYNTDTSVLSPVSKITGEWTKTGNSILTSYQAGVTPMATDKVLNEVHTRMTGTWSANGVVKGYIELNKQ